eukprot:658909-Rhodomonas_salina.2
MLDIGFDFGCLPRGAVAWGVQRKDVCPPKAHHTRGQYQPLLLQTPAYQPEIRCEIKCDNAHCSSYWRGKLGTGPHPDLRSLVEAYARSVPVYWERRSVLQVTQYRTLRAGSIGSYARSVWHVASQRQRRRRIPGRHTQSASVDPCLIRCVSTGHCVGDA